MLRRKAVVSLVPAVILAACTSDLVSPAKTPTGPKLAISADAQSGDYIVLMKGTAIPSGFAQAVAALGGVVTSSHAGAGFATVSGISDDAALRSVGGVLYVQPDVAVGLDSPVAPADADATDLGDPTVSSVANPATAGRYSWQWNMQDVRANVAWAASHLGSASVTAAIIDTGIDYDAPDMNGLVDLSRSTSFVSGDNTTTSTYFPTRNAISDYNGHGTNVATQVSSKAFALAGITSKTTLIGVKVLGWNGSGTLGGVLNGVLWAADHGANVANLSLGSYFSKAANGVFVGYYINRIFNYANRKGMLVVVAAGNAQPPTNIPVDLQHNGNGFDAYCDAPNVICVAAVGPITATGTVDTTSWYSYYGKSVINVAAPGGNYDAVNFPHFSTWPWGNDFASWVWSYCSKTRIASFTAAGVPVLTVCVAGNRLTGYVGTSQASPHVAGLAASLMAERGTSNTALIKQIIMQSSTPLDPAFGGAYGRGRIDVAAAFGL